MARRQAASIAESAVGPELGAINALKVLGKSNFGVRVNRVVRGLGGKHDKGGSEGRDGSGSQKQEGSGSRCYACGRPGHFARDKECPASEKNCARCGRRGNWANCSRMKKETENSGKAKQVRQVQCEDDDVSEWDDDSYAITVSSGKCLEGLGRRTSCQSS